jgi:hypothetical protein
MEMSGKRKRPSIFKKGRPGVKGVFRLTKSDLHAIRERERWSSGPLDALERYMAPLVLVAASAPFFMAVLTLTSDCCLPQLPNLSVYVATALTAIFLGFVVSGIRFCERFHRINVKGIEPESIQITLKSLGVNNPKHYRTGYFETTFSPSWYWPITLITIVPTEGYLLVNVRPNGFGLGLLVSRVVYRRIQTGMRSAIER